MGITGWMVLPQMPGLGLPPPAAIIALAIALVPMSALFSTLCLALAAFARSTKEGQYYLMPLLCVALPLVVLPMSPGVELNLGNSLIPVTGVVLLLRSVLEGNYWQAVQFAPVVVMVTFIACLLSIRWAVEQFNSETVLFRASERLDVGLWLRRLWSHRQPTPTVAAATCCGMLILVVHFFMSFSLTPIEGLGGFVRTVLITQLAVIAAPALLLTLLLTGSPRQTLLLKRPPWLAVPAAVLLAVGAAPGVERLAVPGAATLSGERKCPAGAGADAGDVSPGRFLDAGAGDRDGARRVRGVGLPRFHPFGLSALGAQMAGHHLHALLFGLTHGVVQQSLMACLLGMILGFLAVQSGSILPGMVFHVVHNTLAVANSPNRAGDGSRFASVAEARDSDRWRRLSLRLARGRGRFADRPAVARVVRPAARGRNQPEEALAEAIERGEPQPVPLVPKEAACGLAGDR